MSTKKVKKNNPDESIKASTANIFYNILIFILAAVIIYMTYSIFIKLSGKSEEVVINNNYGAASEIIQVEVLNGCGVSGVADRFTDYLRSNKVDVVKSDNYSSFNIDETIVIDRIDRKANAIKIADLLGVKHTNVVEQLNDDYFLDVSIIIGKDYHKLQPLKTGR
ncbi:MAG: LytR C-terminal domain-containing protein [Melioribacteraceae bacterium]|nr:LytR C-terminal domain-containing protein [Melioribacteraceae bacterium]MCF8353093.1 LytR C-terminal domain-containing protein [Melioribacteraceae bacterium]MCF8392761.1 LytR C-terminal domain-containing protein [Melioribacteraceae bacterium]MCF8418292.1 LytR C-terminal domain-containing protein [Melioribacteraceae bacterium]